MTSVRRHSALLALGAGIAAGLGAAVYAAAQRGSPLDPGRAERTDTWSTLFLAAAAASFILYVAALVLLRRNGARRLLTLVCAVAIVVQTIPLAGPLLLSRDVYAYWSYGRIADQHDANPYVDAPSRYPHDPGTRSMAVGWRTTVSDYGPAFTGASALVAETVTTPESAATVYRALGAAGMLALTGLVAFVARRRAYAAAFVGWNPLLAIHFAGGGHNDVWMMVPAVGALALSARGSPFSSGAAWAVAGAFKWTMLLVFPLELVSGRQRRRARFALGFASVAGAVGAVTWAMFGTSWLEPLFHAGARRSAFGIPSRLVHAGLPKTVVLSLVVAAAVAVGVWLIRDARRGRPRLGLAAAALLLVTPWLLPWYAVWAVPLSATDDDGLAQFLSIAICAYLIPARVPH